MFYSHREFSVHGNRSDLTVQHEVLSQIIE